MPSLEHLRNGLRLCRQASSQIRASQIEVLISVALKPEQTQSELAAECDLTLAAISRFVDVFGSSSRKGRQTNPLGFIETKRHPDDDRIILVSLTNKGKQFVSLLTEVCYGGSV